MPPLVRGFEHLQVLVSVVVMDSKGPAIFIYVCLLSVSLSLSSVTSV